MGSLSKFRILEQALFLAKETTVANYIEKYST